jgi:hypothetical protein
MNEQAQIGETTRAEKEPIETTLNRDEGDDEGGTEGGLNAE